MRVISCFIQSFIVLLSVSWIVEKKTKQILTRAEDPLKYWVAQRTLYPMWQKQKKTMFLISNMMICKVGRISNPVWSFGTVF